MSIVDVHAHHLPEALGEAFTRLSGRPYPLRHKDDHARRLADLDDAGIDEQILGLGAVQPYWADEAASRDAASIANDLYAQMCADVSRFHAFGAVPLPHTAAAAAEAVRCLDDLGFAGVGLGCSANGVALDDPSLGDFWAALDERSAVVYLHPGVHNDLAVGVTEYPMLLGPVFGSPTEEAVALTRLALKGTIRSYPRIRWIAGAMGGSLLLAYSKLFHSLRMAGKTGQAIDPNAIDEDLRSIWYDTSSLDPVLALAAQDAGYVERLLFGSDAPWGSAGAAWQALRDNLPDATGAVLARAEGVVFQR
ncbi:amidohydrolase family protein [Microbacterium yannicii]|uniref:amidohydrolase family protein n=1 Tax=Microbacterium yannicii TaxID=671622 RepID=UPI0002DD62F2|nr:amidohydrolase family protein [Microbacterium yannicii]